MTPVSDSGSPLLADEARQARQAALTSVAAALGLALCIVLYKSSYKYKSTVSSVRVSVCGVDVYRVHDFA